MLLVVVVREGVVGQDEPGAGRQRLMAIVVASEVVMMVAGSGHHVVVGCALKELLLLVVVLVLGVLGQVRLAVLLAGQSLLVVAYLGPKLMLARGASCGVRAGGPVMVCMWFWPPIPPSG